MKKVLKYMATAVFIALCVTMLQFVTDNRPDRGTVEEKEKPVVVLAPYEVRAHRQILEEIGNDYSNIKGNKEVQFVFVREEEFKKELCLRMDRDEAADLIICGSQMMPALIQIGVFQDMSAYITPGKKAVIQYQSLWDSTRSNGSYYGIPFSCDPWLLFYNADLFEEKGLTPPETWEELIELSGKVKRYGTYGFGFPGRRTDERCLFFTHMLYSKGGSYRNVNKEAGITAFEDLRKLKAGKEISSETINWSRKDLASAFAAGKVEMIADSMSMISVLRTSAVKFKIGVARLPGGVRSSALLLGENIGLSATADKEALRFLDYLYSPEVMERIANAMDILPVVEGAEYKSRMPKTEKDFWKYFREEGYSLESYEAWFEISAELSDGIVSILSAAPQTEEEIAVRVHENIRAAIIEK